MSQTTEQIQKSDIKDILENSLNGKRPGPEDLLRLLESDDVHLMGLTAGHLTRKQFGKKASLVFSWSFTIFEKCSTISLLFSTLPYIIVAELGRPK